METKEQEGKVQGQSLVDRIDLVRIFKTLLKHAWLIALVAILCGYGSYRWARHTTVPIYQASTKLYVNNAISVGGGSSEFSSKISLGTAKDLISSYVVILNTRETLNDVIDYVGLPYTDVQLRGMISASAIDETEIFQITVTSANAAETEKIANAIGEILPKRISTIIEGTSVKVVEKAIHPTGAIGSEIPGSTMRGAVLGAFICAAFFVVLELMNIRIRSAADIEKVCSYPVLTMIPNMGTSSGSGHYYNTADKKKKERKKSTYVQDKGRVLFGDDIHFEAAEGYKMLRTKIQFSFADESDSHVIGVSSALAGEGKSITAINLAHSLAQLEKKVILIDCDLRRPSVAPRLELKREPGLSNYLTRQVNIGDVLQRCKLGERGSMHVVVAGMTPPNPVELLSSEKMEKTLEALRAHYDYIILDLPPIDEVGDAMAISKLADGMLMVVRQDYCDRTVLGSAIREFEFVDSRILGIVLNHSTDMNSGRKYGRYKGYYKKYRYRYAEANEQREEEKGE